MKRMLIITPDLSLNGANVVLLELIAMWKDKYAISILATQGGALQDSFDQEDIKIFIYENVCKESVSQEEYNLVFLNTSSVHYYAMFFQNTDIPVYWWFHESKEQLSMQRDNFIHLGLLSRNFHLLGVTPKVLRGLKEIYGVQASLCPMPIKDLYVEALRISNNDKQLVFIPGAYTYIKGQDILLSVIGRLPKSLSEKVNFVFAGYRLPGQDEYYNAISEMAAKFKNVTLLDAISRDEVYDYYQKATCVIAPSRVDSTPTTIVEALMFGKICIVATGAGISEMMKDCVNGFVYNTDDQDELFKRLLLVLSDYDNLKMVETEARKLYEECFEPNVVGKRYINNLIV